MPIITLDKAEPTLDHLLVRAAAIKQEMARLLLELEVHVAQQPIGSPGAWRHHPKDWVEQYPNIKKPT